MMVNNRYFSMATVSVELSDEIDSDSDATMGVAATPKAVNTLRQQTILALNDKLGKDDILPYGYNILDNPDFTNPVNQRGKTAYDYSTGSQQLSIDRWAGGGYSLTVNSGYCTISATGTGTATLGSQVENPTQYTGKTMTLSIDYRSDNNNAWVLWMDNANNSAFYINLVNTGGAWVTLTKTFVDCPVGAGLAPRVGFQVTSGNSVDVRYVKMEQGAISTMGIYPTESFQQTLARCQRYFYNPFWSPTTSGSQYITHLSTGVATSTSVICCPLQVPVAMARRPDIEYLGTNGTGVTLGALGQSSGGAITGLRPEVRADAKYSQSAVTMYFRSTATPFTQYNAYIPICTDAAADSFGLSCDLK